MKIFQISLNTVSYGDDYLKRMIKGGNGGGLRTIIIATYELSEMY